MTYLDHLHVPMLLAVLCLVIFVEDARDPTRGEIDTMATATTATMRRAVSTFGPLQIAITILVAATALVHLFLGISLTMARLTQPAQDAQAAGMGGVTLMWILAVLFLCNFAGYVVLGAALYLPALGRFQPVTRKLLIGYTALTFVAYFAIDQGQALNIFGLSDKAVEAALIALLVIDGRRARA